MVVMDTEVGRRKRRIVFTGDHGRKNLPILRDPARIPECDVLITESTYGDRLHEQKVDMMAELARIVAEEQHDGGRVVVPAFAVGRTQSVVLFLGQLMRDGALPKLPIHVDSPMSREATRIMRRHPDLFDAETRALLASGHDPLFFEGVNYVADVEESKALNQVRSGVIISAAGMCESGRVLHHLSQSIGRREDCVLLVGYQAQGTLGRRLVDGAREVNILGMLHAVRARITIMNGFSAHADRDGLLQTLLPIAPQCKSLFLVHGENDQRLPLARTLGQRGFARVECPRNAAVWKL
jgi:metallo-beta-lactamase family protein